MRFVERLYEQSYDMMRFWCAVLAGEQCSTVPEGGRTPPEVAAVQEIKSVANPLIGKEWLNLLSLLRLGSKKDNIFANYSKYSLKRLSQVLEELII